MGFIEVEPGLRIRFPNQSEDFAQGVEIGALAAMMACNMREVSREIALCNLEQARELACGLGYSLIAGPACGERITIVLRQSGARPRLRLVK